ncbi:serine hydrolase domain-containing protein [Herbiconiux liukaitaii]|uniref:serine hydrolase domain-containing protein n=1 Tax=Herbiconiux liukaitaii TaxID=3342799 RepID=UPI0035B6F9B5
MHEVDEVRRSLERVVAEGYVPGVVAGFRLRGRTEVMAVGRVSFEQGAAPMRAETPFRIASVGKMFSGALVELLLEEGVFALGDPIARWLPELADPRVLRAPDGALDDTVASEGPITVGDLVSLTAGFATPFDDTPLVAAMAEAGVASGPVPPQLTPDEFAARLAVLPLATQPGSRFSYDTAANVLSILLARATGQTVDELLSNRIAAPLDLAGTAFHTDPTALPTPYVTDDGGALSEFRPLVEAFERPQPFASFAGGLISTVPDTLRFLASIADAELLTAAQRDDLTTDHLTPTQREGLTAMGDDGYGWGRHTGVDLIGQLTPVAAAEARTSEPWRSRGRWGWSGGTGTSAYVDPTRDLIGVVYTQRLLSSPTDDFSYFWKPLTSP